MSRHNLASTEALWCSFFPECRHPACVTIQCQNDQKNLFLRLGMFTWMPLQVRTTKERQRNYGTQVIVTWRWNMPDESKQWFHGKNMFNGKVYFPTAQQSTQSASTQCTHSTRIKSLCFDPIYSHICIHIFLHNYSIQYRHIVLRSSST